MKRQITLLIWIVAAGCSSTGTPISEEKPLVSAQEREYSFDHIEGLNNNLAGEGLVLAKMIGGLNALQKEVNARLAKMDCPVRGKVTIIYVVDETGNVLDAATAAGIHETCDRLAEAAIKKMKFTPATKNGIPVRIRMGTPLTFN